MSCTPLPLHLEVPHLHCLIHWKLAVHDFLSSSPIMEVHAKFDTLAVGKLSLNLTGFNKESVSIFGHVW
ncbi:hypothetical protein ACSBR2_006273 [Camellia fascicularis]